MSRLSSDYGFGSGLTEVQMMTPSTGYNVCEFDEFARPGERLTLLAHVAQYHEAKTLQLHYDQEGMKTYIYPLPESRKEAMPNLLKLRDMKKYIYVNKGKIEKRDEKKLNHICAQLADTVWEEKDPRRPILPSEGAGITNTHPGCQCKWENFTILDDDPDTFDSILRPTLQGRPLSDFGWKAHAIQKLADTNLEIQGKFKAGIRLTPLAPDGTLLRETMVFKKIRETIENIEKEFRWISPEYMTKLKKADIPGRILLIRASQATITDHRREGEPYPRMLTPRELFALTRTAIGKKMDINHDTPLREPWHKRIVDAEFDESSETCQMLIHETDEDILQAIRDHIITAVSINAGAPREEKIVCADATCNDKVIMPEGLILGENDDIALTYVVTNPAGFWYNGRHIDAAIPGVKTTAIEILE